MAMAEKFNLDRRPACRSPARVELSKSLHTARITRDRARVAPTFRWPTNDRTNYRARWRRATAGR